MRIIGSTVFVLCSRNIERSVATFCSISMRCDSMDLIGNHSQIVFYRDLRQSYYYPAFPWFSLSLCNRIEKHEISKDLVQKEEYVNNTHQLDSVYGSGVEREMVKLSLKSISGALHCMFESIVNDLHAFLGGNLDCTAFYLFICLHQIGRKLIHFYAICFIYSKTDRLLSAMLCCAVL